MKKIGVKKKQYKHSSNGEQCEKVVTVWDYGTEDDPRYGYHAVYQTLDTGFMFFTKSSKKLWDSPNKAFKATGIGKKVSYEPSNSVVSFPHEY